MSFNLIYGIKWYMMLSEVRISKKIAFKFSEVSAFDNLKLGTE